MLRAGEVARIRLVKEAALAYFCIHAVRAALFLWLPLYLRHAGGHSGTTAASVAIAFEAGALVGSPALGVITDRCAAAAVSGVPA